MKSVLTLCLFFLVGCCAFCAPIAAAAEGSSAHISTGKILEFSLLNLRESLQNTVEKNNRLAFENEELRKSIQNLQQVQEALAVKKAALSGKPLPFYRQQKPVYYAETADVVTRRKRTQELISIFERDLVQFESEIRILEDHLDEKRFQSEKQMLLEMRKKGLKNLSKADKRLKLLEKKIKNPLKTIDSLKREKDALEQEIRDLESRMSRY